jgi:hypothetical protein
MDELTIKIPKINVDVTGVVIEFMQTGDTVSHVGIFDQLCELLPLESSLWLDIPPSPLPCVNKYTVYTYTACKGGVCGQGRGRGTQTDKTPATKSIYRSMFLDNEIWHCFLSA